MLAVAMLNASDSLFDVVIKCLFEIYVSLYIENCVVLNRIDKVSGVVFTYFIVLLSIVIIVILENQNNPSVFDCAWSQLVEIISNYPTLVTQQIIHFVLHF